MALYVSLMPLLVLLSLSLWFPLTCLAGESDDNWYSNFGVPGVNALVWSILEGKSNVIVGGAFTNIGGVGATNIASWDGTNWSSLGVGVFASSLRAFFSSWRYSGHEYCQMGRDKLA